MPPRTTYPRRRRQPTVAAAKRVVTKQHRKKSKKNMDTFFLKAKTLVLQVPSQGVYAANYIYAAAQMLGGNLQSNAEFNLYRLQYDKFRVNSVTVAWTPKANVLDAATSQKDSEYNLSGDAMVHTVIDRDDIAPSSIARLSRYPSYKAFSMLKKWKRTYSVKWPMGVWLDCSDPAAANSQSILNTLGLGGGITFYGENFIEDNYEIFNEPIAQVEISYNVVFQGKTSASLSFTTDESGKVTGVTMASDTTYVSQPLTPQINVRGTIQDTRTKDEITEESIDDAGVPKTV